LTILPPVTALAVGLPAQRAIAQRFRALAPLRHANGHRKRLLIGVDRKRSARGQNDEIDPEPTCTAPIDHKLSVESPG